MTQSTSCPDSAELKELLDGTLPENEQADVNNHLETCQHCQQRLETLVAGKESWSGTAAQLSQQEKGPDDGLERLMDQMKKEGGQTETESPAADEWTLDFLSPPENPEHLGRLGHYEVTEVLGRGGMGIVLKAFDYALHRVVAIKVLAPQLATSPAARKRFEREARAAAAISHEHIVAIYAVEEKEGLPYLVMEYVAGVSLQERLDRSGPLELKEILRIGVQTAKGLAAAHAQGLVHRDIKPANILLHNGVERVKITDFGLARTIDDASLTQSGYVAGTPQYMAPEQARGEAVDHRADLFSLGSVLYALCAGRPPFRASTAMAVLRRVSEESPQPLAEINRDIPPWLVEIIDKLHAKSPAERFQSAQEVADLLAEHLAELQQPRAASVERKARGAERIPIGASRSALCAPLLRRLKVAALFLPLIAGGLVLTEATGLTKVKEWVATVLRISTSEGTLVVEIDDPQVQVTVDGEEIAIHGAGPQEIRVKAGEHRIHAMKDGKPVPVDKDLVTISRGGKQIVRVRQEGTNQNQALGKARETAQITTLLRHSDPVRAVNFMGDGRISVIAGSHTNPHQLAESIKNLLGDTGRGVTIDVHSEQNTLFIRANGQQTQRIKEIIRKLDAEQERTNQNQAVGKARETAEIATLLGHSESVLAVAFSPDGKTLVSAGNPGEIRLWDVATREAKAIRLEKFGIVSAAFSPGGTTLATAEHDNTVKLREADTAQLLFVLRGHTGDVSSVAFAPDGQTLATGSMDGTVKLWRLGTRELLQTLASEYGRGVYWVAFSPDGKTLAVGGQNKEHSGTVKLFEVGSWIVRSTLEGHQDVVFSVAFSPDRKTIATASSDGRVKLWNAANGEEMHTFRVNTWRLPYRLVFSPDGKLLATEGEDNTVKLWDVAAREELTTLHGHTGHVWAIAFSPDGKILASGSLDRTVRLWNVPAALAAAKAEIKVTFVPVEPADAQKLAESVRKLIGDMRGIVVQVDPELKGLVIRANTEETKRVKEIISQLDKEQLPEVRVQHPRQVEAAPVQQYTGRVSAPQGDPIGITFDMDERSFLEYQRVMSRHKAKVSGSPVYVGLSNEQGYPHQGTLVSFDDRINSKTGTVQVHGSLPNPGQLLLPGMFVRVRMPFGPPRKVLQVHESAVVTNKGEPYVLVVNDKDVVERRIVHLGARVGMGNEKDANGNEILEPRAKGMMRIIEEGLDAADWVIDAGSSSTRLPGTHVKRRISPRPSPERAALQQRLATLREIAAAQEKLFQTGRIIISEVLVAKLSVLNAELELAESDKERIGIHEKIVALSREVEQAMDQLYQTGRVPQPDLLNAKKRRLEAEIALEQAKAKATTHYK